MPSFVLRIDKNRVKGMSYPQKYEYNLSSFMDHYDECLDQREAYINGLLNKRDEGMEELHHPQKAIKAANVRTVYVNCYRIHSKKYFYLGDEYKNTWLDRKRKEGLEERYSPFGTAGYYFGLTLNAAFDEALFYNDGSINSNEKFILTVDTYLDNILYLIEPGALMAVWEILGYKFIPPLEMFNSILNMETNNKITNEIGIWAREKGFDGIIFPSTRYEERNKVKTAKEKGIPVLPVLNSINLGTALCKEHYMAFAVLNELWTYYKKINKPEEFQLAHAEPNIVLFDSRQITGEDRTVFYRVNPIQDYKKLYSGISSGFFDWADLTVRKDGIRVVLNDYYHGKKYVMEVKE